MIEIRSYRHVFDLERRIYRVDRLRLNPGGIPVRGVVYLLVTLATILTASRLPLIGLALRAAPWFLSYMALPGLTAALLTMIRLEGRPFHLAARALLRYRAAPRRVRRLSAPRRGSGAPSSRRWRPAPILMLPDGADGTHRLQYTGPGALRVAVAHERKTARGPLVWIGLRPHICLLRAHESARPSTGSVILLGEATRVRVR